MKASLASCLTVLMGLSFFPSHINHLKVDHNHVDDDEIPYKFTTPQALLDDFWNDVDNWRT